jgi:acyl phosphate:glycerol-3-phosphate acyltransferase
MLEVLAVLGGYLLGALPFGYWLPRLVHGEDIRTRGSGNVGATNVFRVYGRRLGIAVALLDVAKGFAAALVGIWAGGALVGVLAGAAAMLGHARPVFLRFEKGGKMVATAGGAFLALAPLATLCCVGIWLAVFVVTRYASVASIVTAVALVVLVIVFGADWPVVMFAAGGALAIVFLHRHNLRRLAGGTEHRFELRRHRRGGQASA